MSRRPVILYRPVDYSSEEEEEAAKHFPVIRERTAVQKNDLVIARYSALPFYEELVADCDYVGAKLVNSYKEHRYIANLRNWVEDLKDITPKTWYSLEDIDEPGPYVLKGETNSRKGDWNTHCFAQDLPAAREVYWRLCTDGLIGKGQQTICIRKYVPLEHLITGLNGIPVSKEFRFFTIFGRIICGAFYWSNYTEDLPEVPLPQPYHFDFVKQILHRIEGKSNFVVVDIADTAEGKPLLIELNDGQQAGLSENTPYALYRGLTEALRVDTWGA